MTIQHNDVRGSHEYSSDDRSGRGIPPHAPSIRTFDRVVRHGGRDFVATSVMASIFSARAQDVMERHDTELVPLLHRDGVELLLVGPTTRFSVVPYVA